MSDKNDKPQTLDQLLGESEDPLAVVKREAHRIMPWVKAMMIHHAVYSKTAQSILKPKPKYDIGQAILLFQLMRMRAIAKVI